MLKIKKREKPQIQWPLTALIDIVFLLLIYFLLTTNFLTEEGINVKLPQAKKASPQQEESITVYVDKIGNFYLGKRKVSAKELMKELKSTLAKSPEKIVVIKADRNVILNYAVKAMDIARASGAKKLFLATEQPLP